MFGTITRIVNLDYTSSQVHKIQGPRHVDNSLEFEVQIATKEIEAKVDELSRFALEGVTITASGFVALAKSCSYIKGHIENQIIANLLCGLVCIPGSILSTAAAAVMLVPAAAVESVKAVNLYLTHKKEVRELDGGVRVTVWMPKGVGDKPNAASLKQEAGTLAAELFDHFKKGAFDKHVRDGKPYAANAIKALFLYSGVQRPEDFIKAEQASGQGATPPCNTIGGSFISALISQEMQGRVQTWLNSEKEELDKGLNSNPAAYNSLHRACKLIDQIVKTGNFLEVFLLTYIEKDFLSPNQDEEAVKQRRDWVNSNQFLSRYNDLVKGKTSLSDQDMDNLRELFTQYSNDNDYARLKTAFDLFSAR